MDVKIGLLLGTRGLVMRAQREGRAVDAGPMLDLAERAEAAGLDSVWVGDSLVSKPRLEPVAAMAAIAARTSRVRIGTAVLLPAIRSPVPLAHALATVDVLSGGRTVLAMGVGGVFTPEQAQDFSAAGVDPKKRAGRFTEVVQVMRRLWTEEHVSFDGKHIQLDDVTLYPRPVQPGGIPMLLATHYRTGSEAQALRAARHGDGIMGISDSPEEFARTIAKVEELAGAEGRDPAAFERVYYMTVNIDDNAERAQADAEDFLMAYYGVSHWAGHWGPWGPAAALAERMRAFAGAGAREIVVRFASWDQGAQWARFEAEVLPAFRPA
ncbi:MAG: LLM class flavin-dependent oxidoreductase [Chloroflexi bacterium]|nr:LLM class flavin-dependent oxidoreductase [Chloroflexota bacterium]